MYDLFYRNPRLLVLSVLLILAAGAGTYSTLPRMEDPQSKVRRAYIFTRFPGAEAARVEALVTERIERKLREVEHIKTVESLSRASISTIAVTLTDDVTNVNDVWSRVRDKLSEVEAELPADVAPAFVDSEWDSNTMIVAVTWDQDGPINEAIVTRYARQLQNDAKFVQGTQHARMYGEGQEEILVEVDPHVMTHLLLTPAELAETIEFADSKVAAGAIRTSENDLLLEVEGEVDSVDRLQRLPVKDGKGGSIVRLGDIAAIRRVPVVPPRNIALIDGKRGVVVAVRMLPGYRIDLWSTDTSAMLDKFHARLPDGVGLRVLFDQSQYTDARLATLMQCLIFGAICVLVVVFVMMGWRATVAIGAALPLSVLCVFTGMGLLDVPIQQMSFTGLVIALGLLIDTPIIVVDEVRRRLSAGAAPRDAVRESVQHLAVPLTGSSFTTILAFMPLVLASGLIGEFLWTLGGTVILAILSSLLLGLTLVPAIAGLMHRSTSEASSRVAEGVSPSSLATLYRGSLDFTFSRPWIGVALGVAFATVGFVMASDLNEQFFPPADRDQFRVQLRLPPHASLAKTRAVAEAAREVMVKNEEVVEVHWFVGTSAPKIYYNMQSVEVDTPFFAQALVKIRSPRQQRQIIRQLQRELDDALPAAQVVVLQLEQGPPFAAPVELRIFGPDINTLYASGEQGRRLLAMVPDVTHTHSTLTHGQPKLVFRLDEYKARLLGLSPVEIARQLNTGLDGSVRGSLVEGPEELPVRVRLVESVRSTLADTLSVDLVASHQTKDFVTHVPVTALGRFDLVPEPATITRRNGRRCNIVQGFIQAGVLPSKVLADYKRRLATEFTIPAGYELEFGGEEAERDQAVEELAAYAAVLLVMIVTTLVWALRSFRLAGVIACVAFLAAGLSIGALWLSGYAFGIMAIIGIMGMIGVAVNDSIVVLAALREDAGACRGEVAATRNVVTRSTRHVLTTTLTTVAGFTPLIIGGGDFWAPLGIVVAGGVAVATLLALYFVPSAFTIITRRRQVI